MQSSASKFLVVDSRNIFLGKTVTDAPVSKLQHIQLGSPAATDETSERLSCAAGSSTFSSSVTSGVTMTYSLPLSSILTDLDLDGLLDASVLLGLEALLGLLDVVLDLEASGLNGLSTSDLEGDADLDLLLLLELPGGGCKKDF